MRLTGLALTLVLAASGEPGGAQTTNGGEGLRVGAARVDITPPADPATAPAGYAHQRLYVRAIVIDDGSARAALIAADQGNLPEAVWSAAASQIASELNAPVQNILMSATHTHSSSLVSPRPGGAAAAPAAPAGTAESAPPLVAPIQVLGSRLKPGCAEKAIVDGLTNMIDRLR